MSTKRIPARAAAFAAALGLFALTGAGTASAHVHTVPEEAAKGGNAKIAFRVPNERPDSGTVKVTVKLPLDHPLSSVRTKPMPGWNTQVNKVELDEPVEVDGARVTEAIASITWTAEPGTRIGPDQFNEFEATLGTLPSDVDELVLPAEQTYESGEVVKWDQPPTDGAEPARPAPTLTLVEEAGGHSHGNAGESEAPTGSEQSASAAGDDTARWLGGAGLAVGALGLGIGGGALLRTRNSGTRNSENRNSGSDSSGTGQE